MGRGKQETRLQSAVADYLKLAYPKVIFTSESSGLRVPMGLAVQMKRQRSVHTLPDLIILEPKMGYHGLCLELKKSRKDLYLKDDLTIRGDKHIQEQLKTLIELSMKNYKATFACGLDEAMLEIDKYMGK